MGNSFDKAVNKGPPFAPECDPKCEPGPNDLRGNICYKGKCVPLCPVDAKIGEDGKCLCNEDNATYKDDNTTMQNDPSVGDGWGYCFKDEIEEATVNKELEKELAKNPNMTEEDKILLKKKIADKVKKQKKEKKKKSMKFNPVSLFVDRTPKELDERVKAIVKAELKKNPKMTDEELAQLISKTTVDVVEELATECEEEYKIVKMILSPKYGNGKWPNKEELGELIKNKNFPWLSSQINQWPEEKSITSCQIITAVKDKITLNNRCIYSDDYPNVVEECNVDCGLGTEVKAKKIIRESNTDFPSLQPCSNDLPSKEFECDSGLICKEDCKLEINMKSFGEARCSKPCDSGDGPGKKTYKVKYVKASQGEPDNMGSCELDEEGKEEGQEYDITVECNKEKCPDCEVKSKGPFKNELVDYTGSINVNGKNKTFTKCLLPKEDGSFKSVDCGGAEGGFNYNKGARAKYNMTYNITKDDYGVQNCTKGKDVIEEGCSVNAFSPDLNPIVGDGGKIVKAGGEECGNECILSDDFPQLVMVEGKECSKTCGGGLQRMRKVVKSKSDAPYCPCKDDPSKCPYEEIACNTQECIAPCVYSNEGNHVQINEMCPGVKGPNKDILWDTTKTNPAGGKGMWYDPIANKHYERNKFVKKMRVPTEKPPVGKGLCYQGDKADKTLPCSIEGTEKPIDAEWGPWKFDTYVGLGTTIKTITDKHSNWTNKKINTVKVGNTTNVGLPVPGSGSVKWPEGDISKVIEQVKKTGHTLGKTIDYIEKKDNKIFMYKKGNVSTPSPETWEFQKGEEQNPNFGKKGEHCISEEGLGMAFEEELPGKRFTREVKVFPEYGGKPATEIDGGNNIRVDPYMKKDDGTYTKYCPVDALLNPEIPIDDIEITGSLGNQDRCYRPSNTGGSGRSTKYTIKELEDEAKRKFVRDNQLPKYKGGRSNEYRILGPGSRTIYRSKVRDEATSAKYGGLTTGLWHEKKENFGDIYDRRNNEYENCEGVGEAIQKIRNNDPSWKSSPFIKQVDCVPVYNWDGKFYKDQASAEAGSTAEEIMKPSQGGNKADGKAKSSTDEKEPGEYAHKTGKFLMSSVYDTGSWSTPSLDGTYGWLARKDRRTSPGWMRMETVSGNIELVKGVVTKGYNSGHHTSKFKVYVSRNGDSWKQMKDSSGNYEFTGGVDQKTNYFKDGPVEAKYIKFYPTAGGYWRSLNAGYVKDKSGAVTCSGGSGMLQDQPYFRFTFNEAKTKSDGIMSEGTANSTKSCPTNGEVMIAKKTPFGIALNTDFDENKIKLVDSNKVKGLKEVMKNKGLPGCGADPSSPGWRSSASGGSFSWSACKKPDKNGLIGTQDPWNNTHGGFKYMYRHWSGNNNNGYNKWNDNYKTYKDNTQDGSKNDGSSYIEPPKGIKIVDYEKVNVIRQPCRRGPKGTVPTPGKEIWKSTTPYCEGVSGKASGVSGYMGEIKNLAGGVEGWIDNGTKYKWENDFNDKIKAYTAGDTVLNDYGVYEVGGTNENNDSTSWGAAWRGSKTHIGSNSHWHSPKHGSWTTSTTNDNWTARYRDKGKFIPIGIRIQPYNGGSWKDYSPTVIRFRLYTWYLNKKSVWSPNIVLGPFGHRNDVKTILIHPNDRKKLIDKNGNGICDHFYVYTRHGYNTKHTAFRINFILAKKGVGKKCVEKSWSSNSTHRPVDCSTSLTAYKSTRNNPGWTSHNQCWMGGKGCGSAESNRHSWKSRTVTITTTRDRVVNRPNYGGKNNCTAATGLNKSTKTEYQEKDKSSCGSTKCNGWSCQHCPGTPSCGRYRCERCVWGAWRWQPGGC
jgi:hypothetical protein